MVTTKTKSYVGALIVSLLTILIYLPGLSGPLILDDGPQIVPLINDAKNLGWEDLFRQHVLSNSGYLQRPLSMLSFLINAVLNQDNTFYWKLTNVILHICTGLVIFQLTRILLTVGCQFDEERVLLASFFVMVFWLLHPLQVSTVLYLVQRMTILAALFTFASLYCYMHAVSREFNGQSGSRYFLFALLVFFPLALMSKEIAVLIPLFMIVIDKVFSHRLNQLTEAGQRRRKQFLGVNYVIILIGLAAFIYLYKELLIQPYLARSFSLFERVLTEPRVIFMYLQQILVPLPSTMGFFHDDFLKSRSILEPVSTLMSIGGLIFICLIVLFCRNKKPLIAFGISFFLVSHLLESTVLPLEIAFEHRNYIGIWGLALAFSALVLSLHKRGVLLLSLIVVSLSCITLYRSAIWGDANRMYEHMYHAHPNSPRLKSIFASSYMNAGLYSESRAFLTDVDSLGSKLQMLEADCREFRALKEDALVSIGINASSDMITTYEMEGLITLANLGLDGDCNFSYEDFIGLLNSALQLPSLNKIFDQKLLLYKAHYLYRVEHYREALEAISNSWEKDETNPIPLFLKVDWLIDLGEFEKALLVYAEAEKIALNSWYDYSDFMAEAQQKLKIDKSEFVND